MYGDKEGTGIAHLCRKKDLKHTESWSYSKTTHKIAPVQAQLTVEDTFEVIAV